jgi:hypothetical protein
VCNLSLRNPRDSEDRFHRRNLSQYWLSALFFIPGPGAGLELARRAFAPRDFNFRIRAGGAAEFKKMVRSYWERLGNVAAKEVAPSCSRGAYCSSSALPQAPRLAPNQWRWDLGKSFAPLMYVSRTSKEFIHSHLVRSVLRRPRGPAGATSRLTQPRGPAGATSRLTQPRSARIR